MRRLPPSIRELLSVGLGAYILIAAFALFCNWSSPNRIAVIVVLSIGLVLVLILEAIAALLLMLLLSLRKRQP